MNTAAAAERDAVISRLDVLNAVFTAIDTLGHICAVMTLGERTMATYMPRPGAVWYFGPTGDEW